MEFHVAKACGTETKKGGGGLDCGKIQLYAQQIAQKQPRAQDKTI
jgi:hypothetical protein